MNSQKQDFTVIAGLLAFSFLTLSTTTMADTNYCEGFWDDYPNAEIVTIRFSDGRKNNPTISEYEIGFISHSGKQWTYGVCEKAGKSLSHWTLSLPTSCREVGNYHIDSYSPTNGGDIESVNMGPDPSINNQDASADLFGIKWNTAESFHSGIFTITMDDNYAEGQVTVAAKAGTPSLKEGVRYGFDTSMLTGPDCSNSSEIIPPVGPQSIEERPLAVQVYDLEVDHQGNRPANTVVKWKTGLEVENTGFHVWVRCSGLNNQPAINGQGDSTTEISYEFLLKNCQLVTDAVIEAVDNQGHSSFHFSQ